MFFWAWEDFSGVESWTTWAKDLVANAVLMIKLAWIRVKAALRPATPRGAVAYKMYAFNECTDDDDGIFHEVYSAKRNELADIRSKLGWDKYRIEIRYTFRGQKYRVVYRHDDEVDFPLKRSMHLVIAPRVTSACLVRKADGKHIDVTDRVRKYLGPDRDFHSKHGLYVRVQDMFPFDDHDDNAERFETLAIWLSTGKYLEFGYADNDVVSI
jgi:hypothetical protein